MKSNTSETLNLKSELYGRVHKGIRKALFQFSEQVAKTNPVKEEVDELIKTSKKIFDLLDIHAQVEENILLPLLQNNLFDIAVEDHADHEVLEEELAGLRVGIKRLETSVDLEEKLYGFYLSLNRFIGNYLLHINNEETKTAFLFLEYCTPDNIRKALASIAGYATPEQKKLSMEFMIQAISENEKIALLGGIKKSNEKAFEGTMDQLREVLPTDEWEKLSESLLVD